MLGFSTSDIQDASQLALLQLPTIPMTQQTSVSATSSPLVENPDPGFPQKKISDSASTPPKVSQLSTLEQELAKLHRRNPTDVTSQNVQSPAQEQSPHIKTYSEVLQQDGSQQQLNPLADSARVRKVSRFAVSVVQEKEPTVQVQQVPVPIPQPIQETQIQYQQPIQQVQVMQQQQQQMVSGQEQHLNKQQLNLNLQPNLQNPIQTSIVNQQPMMQQIQDTNLLIKPPGEYLTIRALLVNSSLITVNQIKF